MQDKFKKFLFPTEDESFLKETSINNNQYRTISNESSMTNFSVSDNNVSNVSVETYTNNLSSNINSSPNYQPQYFKPVMSNNAVFNPTKFKDSEEIAREIMNGNNVIVNLENILKENDGANVARRIIDFLCGAAFASNTSVKRINESTFLFTK